MTKLPPRHEYDGSCHCGAIGMYGIVNVNALRPIPGLPALAAPMDYGTESASQRTGRREQRWSPALIGPG